MKKVLWEEIAGQEHLKKFIEKAVEREETGHAYLFSGPEGSGKKTLALFFARALNCEDMLQRPCGQCPSCRGILNGTFPALYLLKPQGGSLKIGQFREIKESLFLLPLRGRKKVCIIYDAELMTLPAANSLLKILEEPPKDAVFILLAARPWELPPTVLSRCIHFRLTPLSGEKMLQILGEKDLQKQPLTAREQQIVVALSGGNPGKAMELASRGGWEKKYEEALELIKIIEEGPKEELFRKAEELAGKEDLQDFLDLLLLIYRDRLLVKLDACSSVLVYTPENLNKNGEVETFGGTDKIIGEKEELKSSHFLEKICRAIIQLQEEIRHNINLRLAMEVLFLKMRGAV